MGDGDLIAGAKGQPDSIVNRDPADQQRGCEEHLVYSRPLAVGPPGVVHLELRPEIAIHPVLKGGIPRQRHPNRSSPPSGKETPSVLCTSKSPKPLPPAM